MNGSTTSAVSRPGRRVRGTSLLLPLVAVLATLVVGVVLIVYKAPAALGRPEPLPVAANDREIVWLYPAVNNASWERFVAALQQAGERLRGTYPDLEVQVEAAFPPQTATTPEIALKWQTSGRRLVFRWYKLTSKQKTADWVDALLHRSPPPLAIIGGNTSDAARELATHLRRAADALPPEQQPLLLFTTASADEVKELGAIARTDDLADGAAEVRLHQIYADRTFRFCFTNRQIAVTVSRFIWRHEDLRPDTEVASMVSWDDDAYSHDLVGAFSYALESVATSTPAERAWALGCLLRSGGPPDLASAFIPYQPLGTNGLVLRPARQLELGPLRIVSSVGGFDVPNRVEAQTAVYLLKALVEHPSQERPLLVITGQTAPSRRFLRALERNAPEQTRRCVVVTGDAISFNTIYRDGAVTWNIQDLPYRMVFFCHRNPIEAAAGFRSMEEVNKPGDDVGLTATTGTEDVLLFRDIVESLALCQERDGQPSANAQELGERFHDLHLQGDQLGFDPMGRLLFNKEGNRHTGTGEHVVYLQPEYQGVRVLPRSVIEVWSYRTDGTGTSSWSRAGRLEMDYDESKHNFEDAP